MWNTKWCHIYVLSAHGPRIFVPYFPNFCLHPWESVSSGSWLQISSQQAEVPTWHHGFDPMKPRLLAVVLKHLCKLINQSWPSEVLVRECSLWTWPGLRERSHMGLGVWVRSIILALAAILHVQCLLPSQHHSNPGPLLHPSHQSPDHCNHLLTGLLLLVSDCSSPLPHSWRRAFLKAQQPWLWFFLSQNLQWLLIVYVTVSTVSLVFKSSLIWILHLSPKSFPSSAHAILYFDQTEWLTLPQMYPLPLLLLFLLLGIPFSQHLVHWNLPTLPDLAQMSSLHKAFSFLPIVWQSLISSPGPGLLLYTSLGIRVGGSRSIV